MKLLYFELILGIAGLGLYNFTHLLIFRYIQPKQRWKSMKNLYLIFAPCVAALGYWLAQNHETVSAPPMDFLPTYFFSALSILLIIWLIHVGYLTVYAFIDRSITLRTFIEIEFFRGVPTSFKDIEARYNPADAFQRRLKILIEQGFLIKTGDSLTLTNKGRKIGTLIRFLKSLYRTGVGG